MKLSDKYKGKSFAEIAKEAQAKYKDRFDPISQRGLEAELSAVREQQEYVKQREAIKQQLQATLTQTPQAVAPIPMVSNQGVDPAMPQEDMGQFQNAASQSYNEQFFNGGLFGETNKLKIFTPETFYQFGNDKGDYSPNPASYTTPPFTGFGTPSQIGLRNDQSIVGKPTTTNVGIGSIPTAPDLSNISSLRKGANSSAEALGNLLRDYSTQNPSVAPDKLSINNKDMTSGITNATEYTPTINTNGENIKSGIDPMRYAPLASNLYNLISARKPQTTQQQLAKMGFRDRVNENNGTAGRQTQFSNIDMSQLERTIQEQAKGFSGSNANVSMGNSGSFMANELANQSNVLNAISNARMQAQLQNRQTQQLNAQEQARIDSIKQQNAQLKQQAQSTNASLGVYMSDLDARNLGAFNSNKAANIAGLAQNLSAIGTEKDQMTMIANTLGYNSWGEYTANSTPEEQQNLLSLIGIKSKRKK